MIFFTSDLHLGHANVIRHCNRPFASVEEMDEALIDNWNSKVQSNNNTVYVLGDVMFRNKKSPEEYLRRLKGKKHLITGNHDRDWVKKCNLGEFFESVNRMDFLSDGQRQMTLCHFPMMSWPHNTRAYLVHGHIHNNTDAEYWPLIRRSEFILNTGVDINGFAPVTFDEMVENNRRHKKESLELAQSRAEALVELKGKELLRADDELAEAESALEELLTVPEYEKVKDMIERYAACKTKAESQKFAYDFLRGYMNVDGPSAEVLLVDTMLGRLK